MPTLQYLTVISNDGSGVSGSTGTKRDLVTSREVDYLQLSAI